MVFQPLQIIRKLEYKKRILKAVIFCRFIYKLER